MIGLVLLFFIGFTLLVMWWLMLGYEFVNALKEELKRRRLIADRLKKQKHKEHLRAQEASLKSQIEVSTSLLSVNFVSFLRGTNRAVLEPDKCNHCYFEYQLLPEIKMLYEF